MEMTMRALFAIALMTTSAQAGTPCRATLNEFVSELNSIFGEVPQAIAPMGDTQRPLVIFVNPETRTWTIVVQGPDGAFCSPASGTDYQPVPQGEPA